LWAAFDVTVTGGNTSVYFAHFIQDQSTSAFENRVGVTSVSDGKDFTFGIFSSSTTVAQKFASGFNFNETYRLILSWDYATKTSTLDYVGNTGAALTYIGSYQTAIDGFAFRQASGNSTQVIDNLVVASTRAEVVPEPATMVLLGLGGLLAVCRRK
jgi:hypothetical protein